MFPFYEIGQLILLNFSFLVALPIFWVVMIIIIFQYRKLTQMETSLLGQPYHQLWERVVYSLIPGIAGGLLASFVLVFLGFSLDVIGIPLMLGFAVLLLLLVHPRFMCFAYGVGVLALVVFFSRWMVSVFPGLEGNQVISTLADIYLPNLLVLVAVLHLTEALLIYLGGHWNSSPVYFKNPRGEISGGFTLQRFWPVPLVLILATLESSTEVVEETIAMPDWWPILEPHLEAGSGEILLFSLFPLAALLGYSDMAISSTPRQKTICSSRYLAVYSVLLLLLSLGSVAYPQLLLPAVLFSPLGHEAVVALGNQREMSKKPRYRPPKDYGVKVLAIFPDSPADRSGLETGDIIREVNRQRVENSRHFWQLIWEGYFWTHLRIEREDGSEETLVLNKDARHNRPSSLSKNSNSRPFPPKTLGLILVPEDDAPVYVELKKPTSWLKRLKFKQKR